MARSRDTDPLQGYSFWLCDITPSTKQPFVVLGPAYAGFRSASLPTLTASTQQVAPMNAYYPRHYYSSFEVGSITLQRGVLRHDSSFYQWMMRSMYGNDRSQRDILLLHLTGTDLLGVANDTPKGGSYEDAATPAGLLYVDAVRSVGKGYILYDCIPTRYSAGSELDATSADIVMQEIELQPNYFTEFSLDPSLLAGL